MRRSTIGHEVTVGWFIVLALMLGAGGLVLKTRSRGLLASTEFSFRLAHGKGLQSGSPVHIQGIPVGEVSDVELTAENQVVVTTSIAKRYARHIYTDAVVTIEEAALGFSATKVSIDPGSSKRAASAGQLLAVGTTSGLMDQVAEIQSDVRTVIHRLDHFVAQSESLASRLENKEGLAGQLIGDPQLADDVRTVVSKLKDTATRLDAEVIDEALAVVSDARALVTDLRSEDGDLRKLIRDSDAMILAAKDAIEQAKVAETTASLRDAADAMNATAERMDVSEETRDALEAMRKASESFEALSNELERQPDSVIFGRPTAGSPKVRR